MYTQMLRELACVIARLFSIIFDQSQRFREVLKGWRKANATPVFKKG